jgi:hypothetical protein
MNRARLDRIGKDSANATIPLNPKPDPSLSDFQNPSTQQSTQDQEDADFPISTQAYQLIPSTSAVPVGDAEIATNIKLLRQNIEKVNQRGERLDTLQQISHAMDQQKSPGILPNQHTSPMEDKLLSTTYSEGHGPTVGNTETGVASRAGVALGAVGAALLRQTTREKKGHAVYRYEKDKIDHLKLSTSSEEEYPLKLESSLEEMRRALSHTGDDGNKIYRENRQKMKTVRELQRRL